MANHRQQHPTSPGGLHIHHGAHSGHQQANGHMQTQPKITPAHLSALNENVWLLMGMFRVLTHVFIIKYCAYNMLSDMLYMQVTYSNPSSPNLWSISLYQTLIERIGSTYELQGESDQAISAYEQALRHNFQSIQALNAISNILRVKEEFPRAVDYLQIMLKIDGANGEVWGSLGHCYLMMEDLQNAYQAYQNALYHLRDPKVSSCLSIRPHC